MYDDFPEDVGIFEFDEFADHLLDQGLQASPSQLHGCLSGLLSAGASPDPDYGLGALIQSLNLDLHGELAERVMQLYTVTDAALRDDGLGFHALLPDDDAEIALRTVALASWCEGFLAGFAFGVAGKETSGGSLADETAEALRDIAAMAQADSDVDDSEEAEDSYYELVEYLRVAVMNVYMDSVEPSTDRDLSPPPARPLH